MTPKSNKKDAIDFARSLQAEGGTNINEALLAGIEVVCTFKLGYNKLGYSKLPVIMNR
jgi:hypothetical protein